MTVGDRTKSLQNKGFLGPASDLSRAIGAFEWSDTALGPIDDWPAELRTVAGIMMGSSIPSALWWGPDHWLLHEQNYQNQLLADRGAQFGRRFDELGRDIAGFDRAHLDDIRASGRGQTLIDQHVDVLRDGKLTETHWNHNLTPILDRDGRVLGILEVARETTSFVFKKRADEVLIALDDRLLTAMSVEAMIGEALALIGKTLGAQRVAFTEIDDSRTIVTIHRCWTDGSVADLAGQYPRGPYAMLTDQLAAGKTVAIEDLRTDPRTSGSRLIDAPAWIGVRSVLAIPVLDRRRHIGTVMVQYGQPRRWLPYQIELTAAATARLWYAIVRLRAETSRAASEARYRLIFEQANDIIFTADVDQRITDCNEAGAAAMGLTRDEILGRSISEFVSPKDFEQTTSMLHHKIDHGGNTRHEVTVVARDGVRMQWENNSTLVVDSDNRPLGLLSISRDVTARREFDERRELLIHELNHRVKNTLALVQALAQQSFRPDADPTDAPANFEGRLRTLAAAHNLLTREQWEGVTLAELVRAATLPLGAERISASGPAMTVTPKAAVALAMAIHELGTNAIKYGALSNEGGTVDIAWSVNDDIFVLEWREHDGPKVTAPAQRGFGVRMIERVLASDINGSVSMKFLTDGLQCCVEAPLAGNTA
jgi:PAS domain S-box-containing protein